MCSNAGDSQAQAGWDPRSFPQTFKSITSLFGPSAVSSYGDGSVDVVVVNRTTEEVNHRRIGPGDETCVPNPPLPCPAPRVFANLGGRAWEDPVLTAFSPTRLNVLVMQGLKWYSTWASKHPFQLVTIPAPRDPRLLWSGYEFIGGEGIVVSATAHAGRKHFSAVAIGMGGRLFINRLHDERWTGFQPVIGQTPNMILRSPVLLPAVASHGG